jgi:hypothetical protein
MIGLGTLCLALLALSPPGDENVKVQELVLALEDDSIECREKAAAGLLDLGPGALPALRAALEASPGPEAQARIGDVLHRLERTLRRREFRGGEVQGGLGAAVRIVQPDPAVFVVQIEFMNVGDASRPFFPVRWWSLILPQGRFATNLAEGVLEIRQLSGEPCGGGPLSRLCVPGPLRRTPVLLDSGESLTYEYRMARASLPEGEYSVQFDYQSSSLLHTPENLKTNVARFTVGR